MFDIIINYFNPPYVCEENGSVWDKSGLCLYYPHKATDTSDLTNALTDEDCSGGLAVNGKCVYTRCIHGICFQADSQEELDAQITTFNEAFHYKRIYKSQSKGESGSKLLEDFVAKNMDSYKKYEAFKAEVELKKSEIKHAEEMDKLKFRLKGLELEHKYELLDKLNYPG